MSHDELNLSQLLNFDRQHLWHPYSSINSNSPLYLVKQAQGSQIEIAGQQWVVDGMSSWWSTIHGYNHPALNQALISQSQKMSHVMFGGLTHEPAIRLAQKLVAITPKGLDYLFYCDSGSVAVEVAIKMALQYWHSQNQHDKHKLLSFFHGYHGDTFAAMSVCDPINGMHHLFSQVLTQNVFATAPPAGIETELSEDIKQQLRQQILDHRTELAAVIIEPIVQGAGGMRVYSRHFLRYLKDLCVEFDILFIADEIATGFGRTGKLFACEHSDISPDILCIGKALTGGYLSFAATLCNSKVAFGIHNGEAQVLMHGPTFMANPLACAVADASLELLQTGLWFDQVNFIEHHLQAHLAHLTDLPWVADVRAIGAIGVVELTEVVNLGKITQQLLDRGVWLRPFGKLIYTMPPYVITETELVTLTHAMSEVIRHGDIF